MSVALLLQPSSTLCIHVRLITGNVYYYLCCLGWFCAVRMQYRGYIFVTSNILAKTTDLAEARSALGSTGGWSNRQAIIPMSLTTAGDPHTLAKSWSGGSMWWGDNDIEKMQATCRDSKGPGFKPSVLAGT